MPPHRPPGPKDELKIVGPASPPASRASKQVRPPGLYEELITRRLEAALEEIRGEGWRDEITNLDPAEAPGVLARFVHDLVEPLLGSLSCDDPTARQLTIEPHVETLFCDGSWSLCRRDASTTKG